jgi:hypothetical protein
MKGSRRPARHAEPWGNTRFPKSPSSCSRSSCQILSWPDIGSPSLHPLHALPNTPSRSSGRGCATSRPGARGHRPSGPRSSRCARRRRTSRLSPSITGMARRRARRATTSGLSRHHPETCRRRPGAGGCPVSAGLDDQVGIPGGERVPCLDLRAHPLALERAHRPIVRMNGLPDETEVPSQTPDSDHGSVVTFKSSLHRQHCGLCS